MKILASTRSTIFLLLLIFVSLSISDAQSQAPKKMSYQGKLADNDGNPVSDGSYNIKFSIYDVVNSGTAIWEETQGVTVQEGLFNVLLGDLNALNLAFNNQYWLGVKVDSDAEMIPRTALASTPYSLHAVTIADNSVTNSKIVNNTIDPSKIMKGSDGQVFVTDGGNVKWETPEQAPRMFKWRTTTSNIVSNLTRIDHPDLNNNPDAHLVVTHIYRSNYIQAVGVWYSGGKWTIYTEDTTNMPSGEDFMVIYQ